MYKHRNLSTGRATNPLPLSQDSSTSWSNIRVVATDMDGTLTREGKFTSGLLQALENLAAADIKVLIVTGRSSGWVSGLSSLMPVAGLTSPEITNELK